VVFERPYSEDDVRVCNEIMVATCYYKVLGIESRCNGQELKRAFKKKAIKVHPDKNSAPQATDAI
jgi:DnaJ-class molecular chaperone